MTGNSAGDSQHTALVRGLGLWTATAIVIGDTIGSGIFLVTSDMARDVGSAALVFAAWIVGGLIVLCGAFCYAELGAAFPKAGGPYVYLNRGLGPLFGFLFGWMSSFLERPVAMATLAAGFLRFLGFLFPMVATPLFSGHIGSYHFTFTAAQPLAAGVVLAVVAINYLNVKSSGAIQLFLASLKIATVLLIVLGGFLLGSKQARQPAPLIVTSSAANSVRASLSVRSSNEASPQAASLVSPSLTSAAPASLFSFATITALLAALVPAMWAYNGFSDLGDVGEEIREPPKNIPRAILIGLLTVAALYLLANFVYFRLLPFAAVAASQHVASDAVRSFAGSRGSAWLTAAMAVSALGALHVVVLTGARIPYAMARDRFFFQFAGRLHPSFRTPRGGLLFLGAIAALLALSGTYEELYSLFVFAVWIFFALAAVALLRLRRKEPELIRPYRALGYPLTPIIFLIAAVALTVNLWMHRPVRSSVGLAVIFAGIPFFHHWRKLAPPSGRASAQP